MSLPRWMEPLLVAEEMRAVDSWAIDTNGVPSLDLMERALSHGAETMDRTGTGTLSVFGHQMRFDLTQGFPLLTTKKLHIRSIIIELLWFLRGDTNVRWLQDRKVSIWDEWADAAGDLGPVYGKQWRRWEAADGREIDQIAELIDTIRSRLGVTIVLIEHHMRVVMAVADRVTVFERGAVLAEGAPAEIQADERVIRAYLGGRTKEAPPKPIAVPQRPAARVVAS